mgnify:CR=1 FL=1
MKIDRQLEILSILLQKESVTAPYLSEMFEVSRRTINRDIEDLCKAGIPIVTRQGANGGISIIDGYKIDKTMLTHDEMQDILAGLRSLDSVNGTNRYGQLMEKLSIGSSDFLVGNQSVLIDLSSWYKDSLAPKIEVIRKAIEQHLVIANHVLFYCKDVDRVCSEVGRVLKPGGRFVCGTYGVAHMQEVSRLVTQFDDRITLSGENLYEHFGKENGAQALAPYFAEVDWQQYEDALIVTQAEPLIEYVLSCHGNQNQYILEKYNKFRKYVEGQIRNGYTITKDAGIFISVTDAIV